MAVDFDYISKLHRVQHRAILVLNVDTIIERKPACLDNPLTGQMPCLFERVSYRRFEGGQFDTEIIGDIHVVMQMKIEPQHTMEWLEPPFVPHLNLS